MPLPVEQLIIGMLLINTSPLFSLQESSIILLLLGGCNFPVVRQTQEDHDNVSVFEESDNGDDPITSVKEGTCHDSIVTHLHSIF